VKSRYKAPQRGFATVSVIRVTCLADVLFLEQSDEWSVQRRYKQLEGARRQSDPRLSAVVT
jgi:hypothetical protein